MMKSLTISFKKVAQKSISIVIAFMLIAMTLPIITAKAASGDVTGNPAFRVIAYDKSVKIEMPYINGATSYKVYMSTTSGLTDFSSTPCVLSSTTYQPTAYALNGDSDALNSASTISISTDTTYYVYFVTNDGSTDTLQSTFEAHTWAAAKYWTDAGNYDTSWYDNNTASGNTYTISTAAQLAGFAYLVNHGTNFTGQTVKLSASVDMSAYLWKPILPFSGMFDGGNYMSSTYVGSNVIKGLHTNNGTMEWQGLFGKISLGTVKNVGIVDGYIKGRDTVGGVVGQNYSGTVSNCYNTSTIVATFASTGGVVGDNRSLLQNCYNTGAVIVTQTGSCNIGGVVGQSTTGSTIANCYNTGTVTSTVASANNLGGIVGVVNGTVQNCYNIGSVTITGANSSSIGGVAGDADQGSKIISCYNTGNVTGTGNQYVGGVAGLFYSSTNSLTDCYNLGSVTGTSDVGGVVGCIEDIGIISSYAYCNVNSTSTSIYYNAVGSTDTTTGNGTFTSAADCLTQIADSTNFCAAPNQYATGGVFSSGNPVNGGYPVLTAFGYTGNDTDIDSEIPHDAGDTNYTIKNVYQLDLVRAYVGAINATKVFKLWGNIDISPAQYNQISSRSPDGADSWKPIGNIPNPSCFYATFDGAGYSVSGLYINATGQYQGLFGYAQLGSVIENVGVNGSVIADNSYVGSIVGNGSVNNCYNLATVFSNDLYTGGVVGSGAATNCYNAGAIASTHKYTGGVIGNGTAPDCYNLGMVTSTSSGAGGVVGQGDATNCYNTGAVTATGSDSVCIAGVTGSGKSTNCYNTGAVTATGVSSAGIAGVTGGGKSTNCYNTGAVTATGYGSTGIAGVTGLTLSSDTLSNCYNTGTIIGALNVGGIIGINNGTISYCYSTGTVSGGNAGGVAGSNTGSISNAYYFGCATGVGSGSGTGTLPFAALASSSIKVGESTSVSELSSTAITALTAAFGADFNVTYSNPYTSSNAACATVSALTVAGMSPGSSNIAGSFTITQNGLTASGFSGPARQSTFSVSLPFTVTQATPAITVGLSANPVTIGDSVTLTATLSNGYNPTGTVTFYNGGTSIGSTTTITAGVATISYTPTTVSDMSITAVYSGDTNNVGATSSVQTATVSKRSPSLTMPSAVPNSPQTYPVSSVTFSTSFSNYYGALDGHQISFYNGATLMGSGTTDLSGNVSVSLSGIGAGTYHITAKSAADTNNNAATSSALDYSIALGTQAALSLSGVPSTVTYGDSSFTLSCSGGSSTGAVTYSSSVPSVLSVDPSTGTVTINAAGSAVITAIKAGDANYNSASKDISITVAKRTLNATITPNSKPYDGNTSTSVGSISYSGKVGSDDISITGGSLAFSDKTVVDNKTVTASGYTLSGAKASDYTLGTVTASKANITKKALSVSVNPVTIECGQAIPTLIVNVSGFAAGENASNVVGFTAPTASQSYGSTEMPVNNAPLSVTYTGGNATINYSFSYLSSTTLTIRSIASGNVKILPTEIDDNAPSANLQGPSSDIGQSALTGSDQAQLASGSDISIYLKVKKIDAAQADQAVVSSALNGQTLGQYLDVALIKSIDGAESNITQTSSPLRITFAVPNNLLASGRTFSVIRVHDGVAATLSDLDSNPSTVTIETDRFSTYAIVYTAATNTNPVENPKTGKRSSVIPLAVLGFGSFTSTIVVRRRRYKVTSRK